MAGYTRQSTFADGDTITSALFNNEYNQILNAFNNLSGHKHDGTTGEGRVISLIGDGGVATPLNKVLIDSTNDHIEFWVEVSSSSVQQLYIADGAIVPVTDNDIDLGTSSLQFKDLYINGTANIDSLVLATGSTVTAVLDEDDLSSDSATSLVTQQSVKAYIDAQVTAQDLDFLGDSGGALSIDLDSESLTIAGGTGLATVGSGNTITVNIDSTVTTLTGTQTLTNKTLTSAALTTPTLTSSVLNTGVSGSAVLDEDDMSSNSATKLATQQSIKAYVDAQDTAQDLDLISDSGTIAIDLDSELLTVTGGEGIDTSASSNTLTITGEDATTSNKGIASFNSDDFNVSSGAVTLATTSTAAELNLLDGTTAGTIVASKGVAVDANKDITGFRNITLTGELDAGSLDISGNVDVDGTLETDALSINGTVVTSTAAELNLLDGKAFLDEDNMASNSATGIASQQSIKAYVDTTVAATNEVVEDTTPQLGGDLDLNSNDITGTGNINITGTIQSSGNITGTLATAAQPNITSLGTLTGLTTTGLNSSDNVTITKNSSSAPATLTLDCSDTTLVTDQVFGVINFEHSDSSDAGVAAKIQSVSDFNSGVARLEFFTGSPTSLTKAMQIKNSGDISFYEDTGTTQALFWDASAESLGIGVTNPSRKLTVSESSQYAMNTLNPTSTAGNKSGIAFHGLNSASLTQFYAGISANFDNTAGGAQSGSLIFETISSNSISEKMRIDSSGNVGIGTDSPSFKTDLNVSSTSTSDTQVALRIKSTTTANMTDGFGVTQLFSVQDSSSSNFNIAQLRVVRDGADDSGAFIFAPYVTGTATERMRIDSSGNVGIGCTPSHKLQIDSNGSSNSVIRIDADDNRGASRYALHIVDSDSNARGSVNISTTSGPSLTTTGSVGIGTDNPSEQLHVASNVLFSSGVGSGDAVLNVGRSRSADGNVYLDLHSDAATYTDYGLRIIKESGANGVSNILHRGTGAFTIETQEAAAIKFNTSSVERMTIDSSGIDVTGTVTATGTSVFASLDISGDIDVDGTTNLDVVDIDGAVDMATTLAVAGELTLGSHLNMGDGDILRLGTDVDLQIYHDNSNGIIANTTGSLYIQDLNGTIHIQGKSGEESITAVADGAVTLYHNNVVKLATTSTGVEIKEALTIGSSANDLGGTAGNQLTPLTLRSDTSNTDSLLFTTERLADGTDWNTAAHRIQRKVDATKMGYIQFGSSGADTVTFGEGSTERMRIDGAGNVGIGTSSPSRELELAAANPRFRITDTDGGYSEISGNGGHLTLQADAGNTQGGTRIVYEIDADEKMRLDSSGNVGIGTSSPAQPLHVDASGGGVVRVTRLANSASAYGQLEHDGTNTILTSSAQLIFNSGGSETARIDSSGDVGIGTDSPTSLLHLSGASPKLRIDNTEETESGIQFRDSAATGSQLAEILYHAGDQALIFKNGTSAERARIDNAGHFLVATSSSTIDSSNHGILLSSVGRIKNSVDVAGGGAVTHMYGTAGEFRVKGDGDAENTNNAYGAISDERLKENITDATPKLEKLKQVQIKNYNLKAYPDRKQIGVVAQELEQVFPSLVTDNDDGYKTVKYSVFVPMLIKAMQEQQTQIDALQSEINNLKGE